MAHDVFISYSQMDKPTADAALEAAKIRCWIAPRDVLAGTNWGGSIIRAIGESRVMVLVFSSHSNKSQQVLREVERAVNKGAVIVPFRVENIQPSEDLEYYLSAPHWLDALTPPLEAHIQRLCETVGSIIGSHPEESSREGHVTSPETPSLKQGAQPDGRFRRSIIIAGGAAVVLTISVLLAIMVFLKKGQRDLATPTPSEVRGSERDSSGKSSDLASTTVVPTQVDGGKQAKSANGSPTAPAPPATVDPFAGTHAGQTRNDNGLKTTLTWIPPGNFTMGSPKDEKDRGADEDQVQVTLTKGFWLGLHEVTQSEWRRVIQTAPWGGKSDVKEGDDFPATCVSWGDAMRFCENLTEQERSAGRFPSDWKYTLPTEAQWEYACRAGTKSRFSFGHDELVLGDYAWFGENTRDVAEKYAHAVGRKKGNPWGLNDIHGNAWEWCRDWYAKELAGGMDPQGPSGGRTRVRRGGSWNSTARFCRSAERSKSAPEFRRYGIGLRVAVVPSDK
jgi:sulfatase modifying factor 1